MSVILPKKCFESFMLYSINWQELKDKILNSRILRKLYEKSYYSPWFKNNLKEKRKKKKNYFLITNVFYRFINIYTPFKEEKGLITTLVANIFPMCQK